MWHGWPTGLVVRHPGRWRGFRIWTLISALLLAVAPCPRTQAEDSLEAHTVWLGGAYSFSDELGGFRITGVSGTGTKDDPITITEELNSASPVTLVIRAERPIRPFDTSGLYANGFMHLRLVVTNNSGLPWLEFEFELQERLSQPSVFGDGLSFDQRRSASESIWSGRFLKFSRDFEPYDRLVFSHGKVDPLEIAEFSFLITDFTPRWEFFLVQDPRIPLS